MRDVVAKVRFDGLEHRSPVRPLRRTVVADHVGRLCRTTQRQSGERKNGETELDFSWIVLPARHVCGYELAPRVFDMIILQANDKPPQSGPIEQKFHRHRHRPFYSALQAATD